MPSTRPTKNSSRAYTPRRLPPWVEPDGKWGIRDHLWEYALVERIRNGCAGPQSISTADLVGSGYSFSSQGWEAAEKHSANANRLHSAFLDDASIAKRAEKREQLRQGMEEVRAAWQAYNEGKGPRPDEERPTPTNTALKRREAAAAREESRRQWEAGRAEREARRHAEREVWDREQQRREAERAERQAKERIERDRMVAAMNDRSPDDVTKFLAEEARILDSKWSCTVCGGKSYIERKRPGYQLTCLSCGKTAWGSHKALWEVLSK
jgi:hypothetical protein